MAIVPAPSAVSGAGPLPTKPAQYTVSVPPQGQGGTATGSCVKLGGLDITIKSIADSSSSDKIPAEVVLPPVKVTKSQGPEGAVCDAEAAAEFAIQVGPVPPGACGAYVLRAAWRAAAAETSPLVLGSGDALEVTLQLPGC
jgi:hypothetical protein